MKAKEIFMDTQSQRQNFPSYPKGGRKSSVLGLISDTQYYFHLRIYQPLGENIKNLKLTFQLYHYALFFSVSWKSKTFPHSSFY